MESKPEAGNSGARHERRDVHIRGLVIFGVALFVSLVVTLLLMAKIFHYFAATQSLGPPASPFAETRVLPPQPQLQVAPRQDLSQMRKAQEAILSSYGWVDQSSGVVRIPIDRAIDLLAERGLPVRAKTPEEKSKK